MRKTILMTILLAISCFSSIARDNSLEEVREKFVRASAVNYSPNSKVTDRFIRYSDYGRANDVLQLQLYMSVHLPDAEVNRLFSLMKEDGSFSDIDYTDKTRGRWVPSLHLTRLYSLAKLYVSPGNRWYKDALMKSKIHSAINFWMDLKPTSDNWWHNDIGVPRKMTAILIMLRDELDEAQIAGGLKLLERSKFGRTGQNKVWLAANNLMKALLTDDEELLIKAQKQISEEISISDQEGIQNDWAFHQHGPQIQFGNYGQTFAESVSFLMAVLENSPYAFTDEEYDIVANLMKEGICWSVFKGVMDPSFCGRQVFKESGRSKAYSVAVAAQNMAMTGHADSCLFMNISKENLMPENNRNTLTGSKYYGSSDCGIFRTENWYSSIRMHSERTIGFEFTNRENTNAWFSADGALLLMQHGNEYDNIFAHWDWRAVPGTTTYNDGKALKSSNDRAEKENKTEHVGGLSLDNVMCATMELNRDSLHAFKSVFYFDDVIIALGSDIYSENTEIETITTALEQNNLNGKVKYGKDWAWHDGRGYILLKGPGMPRKRMEVSTALQKGKWDDIDPFFKDDWQEGKVFKCLIRHDLDRKDSYAYAILPGKNAAQTRKLSEENGISILKNNDICQMVTYKGYTCAIWHKTEEPCIVITRNGEELGRTALPETRK